MSQFHLQASRAKLAASLTMAVVTLVLASSARAQFVTYDAFDGTTLDSSKWFIVGGATGPDVGGGVASFDGSDAIRSTGTFPVGSTVRVEYTALGTDPLIVGTNSNSTTTYNAFDATFVRNDGGAPLYANEVPYGGYSTPPSLGTTTPGVFEFSLGDPVVITQNGTTLYSRVRPPEFDEPARIELIVYGGGTMTIDNVSVAPVPEPTALVALGLPAAGLLLRRRRR